MTDGSMLTPCTWGATGRYRPAEESSHTKFSLRIWIGNEFSSFSYPIIIQLIQHPWNPRLRDTEREGRRVGRVVTVVKKWKLKGSITACGAGAYRIDLEDGRYSGNARLDGDPQMLSLHAKNGSFDILCSGFLGEGGVVHGLTKTADRTFTWELDVTFHRRSGELVSLAAWRAARQEKPQSAT